MALNQVEVERLASKCRDIATLASLVCNCELPAQTKLALDVLRTLEGTLEEAMLLTREMIAGAEE